MRLFPCLLLLSVNVLLAQQPVAPERKLESLLLMPEPKAMRGAYSIILPHSQQTIFTFYRESTTALNGVESHSAESFTKLGLSAESFTARAKSAADKRLLLLKPELIKDDDGKIAYAVYRGESSLYATLLLAPSLPKIFAEIFGPEIWAAAPDRHALYIFPPKSELLDDFAIDLAERYTTDPFAASCEIFALKADTEPHVVASFVSVEEP